MILNFLRFFIFGFIFFISQAFADNHSANNSQNIYQNLGLENINNNPADNPNNLNNQPLSASQAFVLNIQPDAQDQLINLSFKIAPGYYLYQSRLKFELVNSANSANQDLKNKNLEIKNINYPEGITRQDPVFGNQIEYENNLNLEIPLKNLISQNLITSSTYLFITYQGCSDQLCYPMQHQSFNLNQFVNSLHSDIVSPPAGEADQRAVGQLGREGAHNKPWFLVLAGLFILGICLTFTPCVLPMIPILSSIILGNNLNNKKDQNNKNSRNLKNSLSLAGSYVLGMALTYALVGFLISKIGVSFQAFFQTPLVIVLMALLFIFLGLSTLGLFTLQLPLFIRHKVLLIDQKLKTGSLLGVFLMGVLSTLVISPCTSGPLIGVLSLMASSGNSLFGALSLFVLGLGMGLPLIIISVGLGKFIPKAGKWMQWMRIFMGCLMFIMAIYLFSRIVPDSEFSKFSNLLNFSQTQTQTQGQSKNNALDEIRVSSLTDLNKALSQATEPVIILDFYANWCVECQLLADKFRNENFLDFLKTSKNKILVIRIDVTADDRASQNLLDHYQILGLPTLIILNNLNNRKDKPAGLTEMRLVGNLSVEDLEKNLKPLVSEK